MELIIFLLSISIFVLFIVRHFGLHKTENSSASVTDEKYTIEYIVIYIREYFNQILRVNFKSLQLDKETFEKKIRKREMLRKSLKTCTYGDLKSKKYIKDYIKEILLSSYKIDNKTIDRFIKFDYSHQLSIQDKFEILLYMYKKDYGYHALEKLIVENKLDRPKIIEEEQAYFITAKEIEKVYYEKVPEILAFNDKLEVLVQKIYQMYKGYSSVDEIMDMKIDGISGGVSGIPDGFYNSHDIDEIVTSNASYDSVWIFFRGKSLHLRFLSFGSHAELKRVCKNIYKYNKPGQLTETSGYIVNKMKDGSRVVVVRPPFSESWSFFVRKFDSIKRIKIESLIIDENNKLCIEFIKWLIKGCQITAITGSQGTGKTTLLMSIVKFINPIFNLRVQEMAFELHLRKIYPNRNILTFKETDEISGQEGLDLQKKTDGSVNILGEIATAPVASWMIQMSQVASLFTLFTHHAKTTKNLIKALRNNLLQTGVFNNEKIAEEQVIEVLDFDIHLKKDANGHRYIERITEIIPYTPEPIPEDFKKYCVKDDKIKSFLDTMAEYFKQQVNHKTFLLKDIIVWENGKYRVKNQLSDKAYNRILACLKEEDRNTFIRFIKEMS